MKGHRRALRAAVALLVGLVVALSAIGCDPPPPGEADATPTPGDSTPPPVKPEASPTRPPVEVHVTRPPVEINGTGTVCSPQWDRPEWLFRDFVQWTPDGSTVLFTDGPYIYAVAADGSRLWSVVVPNPPEGKQAWPMAPFTISSDSEHVVFATCDFGGSYELARVRLDGTGVQRLTRNLRSFDSYPAWSPDGTRIAFLAAYFDVDGSTGDYPSGIRPRLYTRAPDGAYLTELPIGLVDRERHLDFVPPRWSPDSQQLAFVKREGVTALYTVAVDGGAPRRLSDAVSEPSWSPDGTRLAFAKPDGDEVALYTINADGTDAQRVTTITGWRPEYGEPNPRRAWIETVAWSPDGSRILYSCGVICVVDLADAATTQASSAANTSSAEDEVHQLPKNDAAAYTTRLPAILAAWSPDGSRIALLGSLGSLATVAPDGSDVQILVVQDAEGRLQSADDLRQAEIAARQAEIAACAAGTAVPKPEANPDLVRDCETLLRVRDELRGTAELYWTSNRPLDKWEGVNVSGWPQRIFDISLNGRDLTGEIPPELGELTHLRRLSLRGNRLGGAIPPEMGQLTPLARLDLSGNSLTGGIPRELGALSHLVALDLSNNQLTGPIPPEVSQLANLEMIFLGGNDLSGCIPPTLLAVRRNDLHTLGLPPCEPA